MTVLQSLKDQCARQPVEKKEVPNECPYGEHGPGYFRDENGDVHCAQCGADLTD